MSNCIKIIVWLIFISYLLVLVNVIILKDGTALTLAKYRTQVSLLHKIEGTNIIPLVNTIIPYLGGKPSIHIAMQNLLGNIFAFSPLGLLLPLLFIKCKKIKNIFIISTGVSLIIELVQVIFSLGSGDIDDLILNVLGSLLGFGVYCFLVRFTQRTVEREH